MSDATARMPWWNWLLIAVAYASGITASVTGFMAGILWINLGGVLCVAGMSGFVGAVLVHEGRVSLDG